MKKIRLSILGLSYSQSQTSAYAMVLAEEHGKRRIPIVIGTTEAQAIAIQLEGLKPQRPLTHDLFLSLAPIYGIKLIEVEIIKLEEGIFYSELVCQKANEIYRIDSRTSDAVAIALRFNCPIYTNENVMKAAGVYMDEVVTTETEEDDTELKPDEIYLKEKNIEELEALLNEAVNQEDYELASKIRDELNKRNTH